MRPLLLAFAALTVSRGVGASPAPPTRPDVVADLARVVAGLGPLCAERCGSVDVSARAGFSNAALSPDVAGHSTLLYDPAFFHAVTESHGAVARIGIIAHEYGHHLDVTMGLSPVPRIGIDPAFLRVGGAWARELAADAWAGCALARLSLPLEPLLGWARGAHIGHLAHDDAVPDDKADSHPPWSARLPALTEGFVHCGGGADAPRVPLLLTATSPAAPLARRSEQAVQPFADFWKTARARR